MYVSNNMETIKCSVKPGEVKIDLSIGEPGRVVYARDRWFPMARVGEAVAEEVQALKVKESKV